MKRLRNIWGPAAGLMLGTAAIGMAPIFVRWSPVGPVSTAFWRLMLAALALQCWHLRDRRPKADARWRTYALIAGIAFGGDLGVWHYSIQQTSVANATLLANLAPIFMLLIAQAVLGEAIRKRVWFAIALSFAGVLLLLGGRTSFHGSRGDMLGLLTALFYSVYLLCLRRIPPSVPSTRVLAVTSLTGAIVVLPFACLLDPHVLPQTAPGLVVLLALAGISQLLGQGLITHFLPRVPTSMSTAILVCQSAFAAFFGWCFLGETIGLLQGFGATLMLIGIFWVRVLALAPRKVVSAGTSAV